MGRAAKRQRMKKTEDVADTKKAALLITCLPFELIAEVLLYSKSPADPLSLSRTCRHFQATLVQNPVAAFIWKSIRAQTTPPVPDPTKLGFSEPELANFIYGMWKTYRQYVHVVFRQDTLLWGSGVSSEIFGELCSVLFYPLTRIVVALDRMAKDRQRHPFVITGNDVLTNGNKAYLTYVRGQMLQANNEYNKAKLLPITFDEYQQRKQKYIDGLEGWMNGCLELCKWKWDYLRLQKVITAANRMQVELFAVARGRDKQLVLDTPAVVRLLREKLLEGVTPNDLDVVWLGVEADLARIGTRRENAKIESFRLRRRLEVERLYRELDHSKFDCFPSLPQFRRLPTLQVFQDSTLNVESTPWRNEFVDTLVKSDVQGWATKTVQAFSEYIGYAKWSSKTSAHPVHWISSRFICTRCSKSGLKAARNKSLTFREAAHHICSISEKWNKDQWSPKNFVVDVKATAVITRFVTAVEMDVQEKTTGDSVVISREIMCTSCSAPIVMDFNAMIQHSHRHDDMQVMILTDEELAKFSDYPVTSGITARFMQTDKQTMEWRRNPYFACKHCIPNPLAIGGAEASFDREAPQPKKKPKAFNFDGLRCHLKEKHKVVGIADEDLFVLDEYLQELGYNR